MPVRIDTSSWVYSHYCYFNNDWEGHALANASTLIEIVSRETKP